MASILLFGWYANMLQKVNVISLHIKWQRSFSFRPEPYRIQQARSKESCLPGRSSRQCM